jgi:hypothetical protein
MMIDLPFDIVELVACASYAPAVPGAPLREIGFRGDAWLPEDDDALRAAVASDADIPGFADSINRSPGAVWARAGALGLRRNCNRPWGGLEEEYLGQHYGKQATSDIAAALGRSPAAIYVRAALLGLTEGNAPPYTDWEIAQVRAGYEQGVPVAQLAVLIGRPASGIAGVASRLQIRHANAPADWSGEEQQRALALADEGRRYRQIAADLAQEGFPARQPGAIGQVLRKLGYSRGWGRPWLEDEDELLRRAYRTGESLTPLRTRLGRTGHSIKWRALHLGLQGTHARPNGWRAEPPWTDAEIAVLKRDYGKVKTRSLASSLGRKKGGVLQKAFQLGLVHGYIRQFSDDEKQAIRIARDTGVSLVDLGEALERDPAVVSKHAVRMGIPFATRTVRAPRGPRCARPVITLASLLGREPARPAPAASHAAVPARHPPRACSTAGQFVVATTDVPPLPAAMLRAMQAAGLLRVAAEGQRIVLLTAMSGARSAGGGDGSFQQKQGGTR